MEIQIESIAGMSHGETRTFDFIRNGRAAQGFVIKYQEGFYAYHNMCCHWPVPMDMGDGDFFAPAFDRIMCKSHGAVYQPDTGICDYGPCVNAKLDSYPVVVQGDKLIVTVPD
jgi:nitrite reductase/ring-hydroxylating ferredoxin subunit